MLHARSKNSAYPPIGRLPTLIHQLEQPARSAMAGYAAYINTLQARPTPPRFPPPPALPSPEPVPKLQLQLSLPAVRTNNIMSPPPPSAVDEDVSRQRRSYGTSTEGEAPDDGGQGRGQRQGQGRARFSLLIINPNSTKAMTDALEPVVTSVLPPDVRNPPPIYSSQLPLHSSFLFRGHQAM